MRFRLKYLERMQAKIVQMGLEHCQVCQSGLLYVHKRPALLSIGGFHHDPGHPLRDEEANVRFLVHVECDACGYVMLFDSEKLEPSNSKGLVVGLTEEEEAQREADGEWDD